MDDAQRTELLERSKRVDDLEAQLAAALTARNNYWITLKDAGVGASDVAGVLGIHRVTVQRVLDQEREIRRRVARETGKG